MRSTTRAAAVLAVIFCAASASALNLDWLTQYKKPNIHYGQLALHPYYQLTELYDSNIYLVPHDQNGTSVGGGVRGSWITMNELALEAVLPWRRLHTFSAGYDFLSKNYTTQSYLNDTINQAAHVDYVYTGAYGITVKTGDQYANTTDQAFSELVERNRRWTNKAYVDVDYTPEHGRLAGGADASHTTVKYLGPSIARSLNRFEDRAGFNVGYMVQPKTKAYVSYHRTVIHYSVHRDLPDQDKDNKAHDVGFGVAGQISPKVTGQIEGGVTFRRYDEAPIGTGGVTRETRNVTAATNLDWKYSDNTNFIFAASRRLEESISSTNRFYISNNVSLDVKHKLPRKFSVGANVAFGLDKYPDTQVVVTGTRGDRRDDIYQGGAWVEYDIQQWLSTGLSYVFRERNSTFSGEFNYQDQQVAWNAALKF